MIYLNNFDSHTTYESKLNVGGVDFKIPNVSYCEDVKDVHYNPYNTIEFYVGEITEPQTANIYTDETNHVDVTVNEGNKWYSYVLPKDKGLFEINGNNSDVFSDDIITKVIIKANISSYYYGNSSFDILSSMIPQTTMEASFKGSNTSNVTIMSYMFQRCDRLKTLDLSSWDTSKVTNMYYMFNSCKGLISLDLSNFNTSNVTNIVSMFGKCSGLTKLDLSGWNISKVTNMDSMFIGCNALKEIRMVGCSPTTIDKIKAQLTKDDINGFTIVTE